MVVIREKGKQKRDGSTRHHPLKYLSEILLLNKQAQVEI